MAKNVTQTHDEPHDRLTRICDAMTNTLERHSENPANDVKAVILLDDGERGGLVSVGYDKAGEMLMNLLEHAEAIAKANGIPLAIAEMPGWPGGQG